jgi:hypothetical protein
MKCPPARQAQGGFHRELQCVDAPARIDLIAGPS